MQGTLGAEGRLALVTLACPVVGVRADVGGAGTSLQIDQNTPMLQDDRAGRFLSALGVETSGRIRLRADLPVGGGAGMSTAALVALARSVGAAEDRIAHACLAAEGASDPLMLPQPDAVLWAPRIGQVLQQMPASPAAEIVGGLWGPPVWTDPTDTAFPKINDLVAAWTRGPELGEAARLATLSAERTRHVRGPADDPTPGLVHALGALGYARAHTGPARALIFAPGSVPGGAKAALHTTGYTHIMRFHTGTRA